MRAGCASAPVPACFGAPGEVSTDLVAQVAKLNNGLMCDRYGPPLKEGDDEDAHAFSKDVDLSDNRCSAARPWSHCDVVG